MIPDSMPTAIADFFNWLAKAENGGIEVSQLGHSRGAAIDTSEPPQQVKIRLGEYRHYGQSRQFTIGGRSIGLELAHIVKLSPNDKLVTVSGSGQGHTASLPDSPTFTLEQPLSWVQERADIKTDKDQAALRTILGDFTSRGDSTEGAPAIDSQAWADQFATLTDAQRDALAVPISQITAVPAGFPSDDLSVFKRILRYFFTYDADGSYYAKGTVAPGAFPIGVTDDYIRKNQRELELTQGRICVVVRAALKMWDNAATDHTIGREVICRLDDRGADHQGGARFVPYQLVSSRVRLASAGQSVEPTYHFGFFYTVDGVGPNFSEEARPRVGSDVAAMLATLPADPTGRQRAVDDPEQPVVGTAAEPRMLLIGTLADGATLGTLPEGVESAGDGQVRTFSCPVDKLDELAAVSGLVELTLAVRLEELMTKTRTQINVPTFLTTFSRTAANAGTGVLIGVVDGGFDVGHRAFLDAAGNSRVVSLWDQSDGSGQTPRQRATAANRPNYAGMTYGTEYLQADANFTNRITGSPNHGTHVASIAGGTAFSDNSTPAVAWPGGVAQGARFAFVATGIARGFATDVSDGVRYCLEKARALGVPCVVNISLGIQRHAHDGTDALSRLLTQHVTVAGTSTGTGGARELVLPPSSYAPGKVICAAAGNDRNDDDHVMYEVTPGQSVTVTARLAVARNLATFWAHGAAGLPVDLEVTVWDPTDWITEILNRITPVRRGPSNIPVFETLSDGTTIGVSNGPQRPNQHYNIEIIWAVANAVWNAGNGRNWGIRFTNHGRETVTLHGWEGWQSSQLSFPHANATIRAIHQNHKVSTPGTAIGTICVAALDRDPPAAGQPIPISSFSAPGPLRAAPGRMAIDVAAPGTGIVAAGARSASGQANNQLATMSGTSMASPVVTGFVALLMEQDSTVTTGQVRSLLADIANTAGDPPVNDFGTGRLDLGAVTTALFNQHTD